MFLKLSTLIANVVFTLFNILDNFNKRMKNELFARKKYFQCFSKQKLYLNCKARIKLLSPLKSASYDL